MRRAGARGPLYRRVAVAAGSACSGGGGMARLLLALLPLLLLPLPGSGRAGPSRASLPSSPLAPAARSPRTPSALIGWRRRRLRCAGCGGLASGGDGAGDGAGAGRALAAPLSPSPSPGPGSSGCEPGMFRCEEPHGECFPREWICDGHPDCMDERDERGCEASGSPAGPGAGGTGEERGGEGLGRDRAEGEPGPVRGVLAPLGLSRSWQRAPGAVCVWGRGSPPSFLPGSRRSAPQRLWRGSFLRMWLWMRPAGATRLC
ncbi:CD320 molecule isoform X2 [Aix galericulata]|nr:CD320 molecule isoform X2 [Aix galericulata]